MQGKDINLNKSFDKDLDQYIEEKKEKSDKKRKKKIKTRVISVFTAAAIVGGGYAIVNRNPDINLSNDKVVSSVSDNKSIDEVLKDYNKNNNLLLNDNATDSKRLEDILVENKNIVDALDDIKTSVILSNMLEELELNQVDENNGNLRALNDEEKTDVLNCKLKDLYDKIYDYKKMKDIDNTTFSQKSIDKNRLAMDLGYAEYCVNQQLINYSDKILSQYGELLVKSIIIDETSIPYKEYKNINIKKDDSNNTYILKYEAKSTGQFFEVEIKRGFVKEVLDYSLYFRENNNSKNRENYKEYRKKILKAINEYKKATLANYKLSKIDDSDTSKNTSKLQEKDSNRTIRNKVKKLS